MRELVEKESNLKLFYVVWIKCFQLEGLEIILLLDDYKRNGENKYLNSTNIYSKKDKKERKKERHLLDLKISRPTWNPIKQHVPNKNAAGYLNTLASPPTGK